MRKMIKIIGIIFSITVVMASLPVNAYASGETIESDASAAEAGMIMDEEAAVTEEPGSEAADPDKAAIEAVYIVEGGAYTYDADMTDTRDHKELFSAIYNDRQTELFGGRYYTGEQVVSLTGKSGSGAVIKRKSDNAAVNASAVTGAVEYTVTALPWELADDFSYTAGDLNYEQRTVSANDLTGKKLYAWEYEKRDDGLYERVSVQEITDYQLNARSGDSWDVSGSVVIDYSKLKNKNNPVAVIAFLYDATKDSDFKDILKQTVFYDSTDNNGNYYSPIFAALCYSDTDYVKGSDRYRLYEHDPDNEYLNTGSRRYYDDEIYSADRMGTFSMAPYVYLRDDTGRTVTLFTTQVNNGYGLIYNRIYRTLKTDEFRFASDLSHYTVSNWTIPAKWTDMTTGKEYNVKLASAGKDDEGGDGRIYPYMMTGTLTVSEGVGFPDDCSYLFVMNGGLEGIVIEGSAKSVGGNITNMEGMFWGNEVNNNAEKPGSILGRLDIKALNTENVTNMSRMFYGQRLSEPLDVSTLNTSKVVDFSYMFYQLYSGYPAVNPDVSGLDTSSATDMSYMFAGVGYVGSKVSKNAPAAAHGTFTELDVSNFDFTNVKSIRGMFSNNDKLSKIILPSAPKTGGVEDMSELFMSCSSLADGSIVNLDKLDTSGCTDMAVMFGCDVREKLIETRVNDNSVVIRTTPHKYGYSLSRGPAFTSLDLSSFNTSKVRDMSGMFDLPYCTGITFGDDFDVSKVELMQGMFTLPSMRKLDISGFNTGSLMNASYMFKDMPALTELKPGSLDLTHIESMYSAERMFDGCLTLKELDMSSVKFGDNKNALGKDSLVYLNEWNNNAAESGCCGLTTLKLPAALPAFAESPDLPCTMKDEDGNEYKSIAGGNTKALVLTAEGMTTVEWISVQDGSGYDNGELKVGRTKQLIVKIYPYSADQSVTWTSSASNVAAVDKDGVMTGMKAGTATITAVSVLDKSKSAEYKVTVTDQGGSVPPGPAPKPFPLTGVPMTKVRMTGFKSSLPYAGGAEVRQNATLIYRYKSGRSTVAYTLVEGTDYKAVYENNYDLGTARITYEAVKDADGNYTGGFTGSIVKTYKITGRYTLAEGEGGNCTITLERESYPYANGAIKPQVTVKARIVNNSGVTEERTLTQGKDYTAAYKNNKAVAGIGAVNKSGKDITPQVIIKGKGKYLIGNAKNAGVIRKFEITKRDLSSLTLTLSDVAYNKAPGKYKNTRITLFNEAYRNMKLKAGKDYTASYVTLSGSDTPAAGERVTVTLTAAENNANYTGSISGTYRIKDKTYTDISKARAVINPNAKGKTQACSYTGSGICPGQSGQPVLKLTVGSGNNLKVLNLNPDSEETETGDYAVIGYYNNINPGGNAVILIRGTGKYCGVRAVKFRIADPE